MFRGIVRKMSSDALFLLRPKIPGPKGPLPADAEQSNVSQDNGPQASQDGNILKELREGAGAFQVSPNNLAIS